MKLRNMTGIYLSCKGQMLLLYRQGGRVVSNQWIASAGGHFEKDELNDPKACVLRELQEELNLREADLTDMKMRYIGLRNVNGEIRQNYYFFANLKPEHYEFFRSNDGNIPTACTLRFLTDRDFSLSPCLKPDQPGQNFSETSTKPPRLCV